MVHLGLRPRVCCWVRLVYSRSAWTASFGVRSKTSGVVEELAGRRWSEIAGIEREALCAGISDTPEERTVGAEWPHLLVVSQSPEGVLYLLNRTASIVTS